MDARPLLGTTLLGAFLLAVGCVIPDADSHEGCGGRPPCRSECGGFPPADSVAEAPRAAVGEGCRFHQDCVVGALCVESTCHARCTTAEDCSGSRLCSAGVCAEAPVHVCRADEECAAGASCVEGYCAAGCATDARSLIYLLSDQGELYAFEPRADETAGVRRIGRLHCGAAGQPQSMAVDRTGLAWVFYDSGELFQASTTSARCRSTTYRHPVQEDFNQLGMSFTGGAPETLFIVSPAFGLASVNTASLEVTQRHALVGTTAELAGDADGRLFVWEAEAGVLTQLAHGSLAATPLSRFPFLGQTSAWAFAKDGGRFFLFSAPEDSLSSAVTISETGSGQAYVRDYLDFVVVGAGRSMCTR